MDTSKALLKLTESADLLRMLEDLSQTASPVSPGVASGFRIMLRNIREAVLHSHDTLAAELMSRSRGESYHPEVASPGPLPEEREPMESHHQAVTEGGEKTNLLTEGGRVPPAARRTDLRASIEKIVGRQ